MVEARRQTNGSSRSAWRWRAALLCIITVTLVVLGQMLLAQFRSWSIGSLLQSDNSSSFLSRTSTRVHRVFERIDSNLSFPLDSGLPLDASVALLISARAGQEKSVAEVPFLQECLPSLLKTIGRDGKFVYSIYFGFDVDDPIYDNSSNLQFIRESFDDQAKGYQLSLKFFRYNGTRAKPVWVWNRLARAAYEDKAEYLYQVNDDVRFVTKDWTSIFVRALLGNKVYPGLGVAGPCDLGNSQKLLLTQSFVSRVHLRIFKHFYPPLFRNWYSDDWISQVYNPDHLFKFPDVLVKNTLVQSTRYDIDYAAEKVLSTLVSNGKASIDEFLQSNVGDSVFGDVIATKTEMEPHLLETDKKRWR